MNKAHKPKEETLTA